ncbi:type II toxin-antitoxin system HicA family toxin [Nodularia sp. NIES-3585]|uniref:type II toxin-antitoxin system HicA family toxin n=1 Tax=Nodularia sp. NIES-3585 TaxID=1973477 RepID=UPI000B6CC9CF|nr:type II toxin-antitoxin system HicA family toxin [Nodularia sp. NIES-3585]GAX35773.1 hypothetical protein NIES3585_17910 [Nodularia sp. NIES-3585]
MIPITSVFYSVVLVQNLVHQPFSTEVSQSILYIFNIVKKDKLIELLKNSPNNVKFSDIRKLLELEGFALDRITGSHHIFKKDETILVIPVHNNRVKSVYIKRVLELIEGEQS